MDSMLNSTIFEKVTSEQTTNNNNNNNIKGLKNMKQKQQVIYGGGDNNGDGGLDKFILDFDMFDINTGKIISCDHDQSTSPPKYEPSVRWNTGLNYQLEQHQQQIHKSINNIETLIEESEKFQQYKTNSPSFTPKQQIQQNQLLLQQQQIQLEKLQREQLQLESLKLKEQELNEKQQELIRKQQERDTKRQQQQQEQQQHQELEFEKQLREKEEKEEKERLEKERIEKESVIVECKDMCTTAKINQLQHYVNERFEISCIKFYSLMIDSDFWTYVSREVGFLDMKEGEWMTSPQCCHQERLLHFKTPISFKIGPKVATVQQTQKIRRTPTNGYVMETSSLSKDVPYGESFSVENYLSLEPCPDSPNDACILKVSTAVKFIKSIWGLGGIIEKTVTQSNKDFFGVWINFAKKRIFDQPSIPETLTSVVTLINTSTILSPINSSPIIKQPPIMSQSPLILNNNNVNNNNVNIPPTTTTITTNTNLSNQSINYDEIKNIFYKLFKEMNEEKEETKVVKIYSVKKNQHLCNLTVSSKQTLSYLVQFLIPQMFPQLNKGQHFELYWIDKRNEYCQFFYKDLDSPIFSFICNLDVFGVQTITEQQASSKLLSFVIMKPGENANIRYNNSNIDHSF